MSKHYAQERGHWSTDWGGPGSSPTWGNKIQSIVPEKRSLIIEAVSLAGLSSENSSDLNSGSSLDFSAGAGGAKAYILSLRVVYCSKNFSSNLKTL